MPFLSLKLNLSLTSQLLKCVHLVWPLSSLIIASISLSLSLSLSDCRSNPPKCQFSHCSSIKTQILSRLRSLSLFLLMQTPTLDAPQCAEKNEPSLASLARLLRPQNELIHYGTRAPLQKLDSLRNHCSDLNANRLKILSKDYPTKCTLRILSQVATSRVPKLI
jgi:hypothetical protein